MRKVLKVACQNVHSSLKLNQLSRNDANGVIARLTRVKLMRYSLHELPFSLSRSIRGVGPEYKYNDVLHRCFQGGETVFDAASFRETMNRELKSEVKRQIGDYNTFIAERFHKYPAWSSVLPWDNLSCDEMRQVYLDLVHENRQEFAQSNQVLYGDNIDPEALTETHVVQFEKLWNKILSEGFRKNLARPRVNILSKGNKWIWMMTGQGNHRYYILSSMDYSLFPCEITRVIRYEKLHLYRNVENGCYTLAGAQELFNTIFKGNQSIRGII